MKALVYTNPDEMQFLDQPDPVLADNEVLLKIDAVGICGSIYTPTMATIRVASPGWCWGTSSLVRWFRVNRRFTS